MSLRDWLRYLDQQEEALSKSKSEVAEPSASSQPPAQPVTTPARRRPPSWERVQRQHPTVARPPMRRRATAPRTPQPLPERTTVQSATQGATIPVREPARPGRSMWRGIRKPRSQNRLEENFKRFLTEIAQLQDEIAKHADNDPRWQLLQRLFDPDLSVRDVALLLDVCPTTIRRYTNAGLLEHYRTTGNRRRFRLSHILRFLMRYANSGEASSEANASEQLQSGDNSTGGEDITTQNAKGEGA